MYTCLLPYSCNNIHVSQSYIFIVNNVQVRLEVRYKVNNNLLGPRVGGDTINPTVSLGVPKMNGDSSIIVQLIQPGVTCQGHFLIQLGAGSIRIEASSIIKPINCIRTGPVPE